MAKEAKKHFIVDPWQVIERGFDPAQGRVAESIFSLGNEYMGVRGQFDEAYTGDRLVGCYYNGVFEEKPITYAEHFKGLSQRCCFMVNANNWLYTRITANGEELDLAKVKVKDFVRTLDMKTGILTRSFIWQGIRLTFERFVSMECHQISGQKITFEPVSFRGKMQLTSGVDFSPIHEEEGRNFWEHYQSGEGFIECRTQHSKQSIYSAFRTNLKPTRQVFCEQLSANEYEFELKQPVVFEKVVYNLVQRGDPNRADELLAKSYTDYRDGHVRYWEKVWDALDIVIEGDEENQQGVRFCIFNLHQTYHGEDGRLNVGAKGLTGEKYSGWTFWDSETYCLPFYMFNNPKAARNLLMYRYNTLPQALARAEEQDCKGACYPMVTIDGTESCGVWQHGNIEIHVTAAVAYGVWHYVNNCGDKEFLYDYGIELLLQTSRYFASRGGWSPKTGEFGFWGVMGPDEFHMMVHNNTYTNYMVKRMLEYTLQVVEEMRQRAPDKLVQRQYTEQELATWKIMAEKMRINFDPATQLYEQHDGYFDLPEVDVKAIPPDKVPVYKYWAYDSIFRCNMLKQPDVVLMQFFFSHDFSLASKQANYEFYEPRCSHESSLSPAIHSIMAAEIGNPAQAYDYARHGSRLDLDDYNRNVHQGLHVTSMAAAWMNVVYGFGGMRSDGPMLSFRPTLPPQWTKYSFKLLHQRQVLTVTVESGQARFKLDQGEARILVHDREHLVSSIETIIKTTSRAVIFDLDGVIVTTDDCHYEAWKRMANEEGIYFDRTINERLRGVSRMESLAIVLEKAARPYTDQQKQAMADRKNRYYCELIRNLTARDILPGVMEVLEILKQSGVKTAIGSSSKNAPLILNQVGLTGCFDAVVCGNDIKNSKPHPEVFLLAARKLGVAPEDCLVVEDADAGIEAAKTGGMLALGVGSAANNPRADYAAANLHDPLARVILTSAAHN